MNWSALQAIAELGGAVAVVVSLVYLAAQVRQNTIQVREQVRSHHLDSLAAVAQKFASWRLTIAEDADIASVWQRGNADLGQLNAADRLRFDYLAVEFHRCLSIMSMFADQGVFDPALVEHSTRNALLYAGAGLRDWWRVSPHRSEFPTAFAKRMDDVYATASGPSNEEVKPTAHGSEAAGSLRSPAGSAMEHRGSTAAR